MFVFLLVMSRRSLHGTRSGSHGSAAMFWSQRGRTGVDRRGDEMGRSGGINDSFAEFAVCGTYVEKNVPGKGTNLCRRCVGLSGRVVGRV